MGKIKELNDVVDTAKEIMKKDKNIGWLAAIEEAKKVEKKVEKKVVPKEPKMRRRPHYFFNNTFSK